MFRKIMPVATVCDISKSGINMRASASSLWYKMCTQDFLTNMAAHTDGEKKILHIVNTFRVTHEHTQLMQIFLT